MVGVEAVGPVPRIRQARLTGSEALLQQLLEDETAHVFGNPGTTELGFLDGLRAHPELRYILALNEPVAVGLAEGYARVTHRPAFVQLHVAAGLGNGLGMLYNATQARTPLVVYAGNASAAVRTQEPVLGGDLVAMARPVCKWAVEAATVADLPRLLRRATKVAAEPPQGPVLLSVPSDLLAREEDVLLAPTRHVDSRVLPHGDALRDLGEVLNRAAAPLLLLGDGLIGTPYPGAVERLAELLGAPMVGAGWSSEPVVDPAHPMWLGSFNTGPVAAIRAAYRDADVLIHLGTSADRPAFEPLHAWQRGAAIVQIDLDRDELVKNVPAQIALAADPGATAAAVAELLREELREPESEERRERARRVAAEVRAQEATRRAAEVGRRENTPIVGSRLAEVLDTVLGDEAVVYDESLSVRPWTARRLARGPGSYYRARGSGIGSGMSAAVGAQIGLPDRRVVGLVADGSAMYSFAAVWSAAHHKVPVTWVIANNRSYRTLKVNGLAQLGDAERAAQIPGTDLDVPPIAFDGLAQSLGARACRVERPDELEDALRDAVSHPGPSLVEVVIDGQFP